MLQVKRHEMSGRGTKVMWSIVVDGQELLKTTSGSFHAWTKKKDCVRIKEAIETYGIDNMLTRSDIDKTNLVNLHLLNYNND